MKAENLRIIAARLRQMGQALQVLAGQVEAEAPHLGVNLPRDLFSDLEQPQPQLFEGIVPTSKEEPFAELRQAAKDLSDTYNDAVAKHEPARRTYRKNPRPMQEHLAVSTQDRVGKAQGFCARNDIERSVARLTGRSREDVRVAVNRVAARMRLTCVKSNSYRYYPRAQRREIVDAACKELETI